MTMTTPPNTPSRIGLQRRIGRQALHVLLAMAATLLALPVNAGVVFPDNPLQTGAAVPPNVMFILDNSGSMASVSMPACNVDPEYTGTSVGCSGTLSDSADERSYLNNTIYYDPNIDYQTWMTDDGLTRMTGGTEVTSVYKSWNQASAVDGSRDLRGSSESIFYVPKAGVTSSTTESDFVRYRINGAGQVVTLSVQSQVASFPKGPLDSGMPDTARTFKISVPAGTGYLAVSTKKGGKNVDLYLMDPAGNEVCRSHNGNNAEKCVASDPAVGLWEVRVERDGANFIKVSLDAYTALDVLETPTRNPATIPASRSQADELTNIATWYSYYRTRLKTAKAGASEAFASLGRGYRVGYTPINGRSSSLSSSGTGTVIPVDVNDGRFEDDNKTGWFNDVQTEIVKSGSTPLRTTLNAVGGYYKRTDDNGPWGNGAGGEQLSCRPNFSILTTDGYWNDSTSEKYGLGDEDGDGNSVTLADIASYYYKTDLRSDMADNVPPSPADPADWQHMVTFSLSIGLEGNMTVTDPPPASNSSSWTNPMNNEDGDRIDDLWHAAVNGHGTFVAASNPVAFAKGLIDALSAVGDRTGSASNVTSNSTSFLTNTAVYQASYKFGKWTGELEAYHADSTGVSTTPLWSASERIFDATASPARIWSNRKVYTSSGSAGTTFPTGPQATALARSIGVAQVTGAENAQYIKGDQSMEKQNGGALRNRTDTVLGDIVDSSPLYVEDSKTVFVGANDGMLHAFDASTNAATKGVEQFAYVPAGIKLSGPSGLASLSDPQYVHSWYVDGPIVVSTLAKTPDTNYLVGALGRGGKGLYGLDVTTPSSFSASDVLWDKTGSAAPTNMGQVLGEPLVVKLNDGTTNIIVSNGVNSSSGTASLFVINIATGAVIEELNTGYTTGGNGLSAPRGWDNDGNGTVDYVYAGDMQGNLWKFDFTSATSGDWAIANGGSPMFVATDATNKRQPITAGLGLAKDPKTGKRWVFIGTGKFMDPDDVLNMDVQSMYAVIDDGGVVTGRTSVDDGDLQARSITLIDSSRKYRGFEPNGTLDSAKKGWYIDLLTPPSSTAEGERLTNRPLVVGTVLITASMIPPSAALACDAGGRGYINALDAFSGTSTKESFFDTNHNGDFNDDTIGPDGSEVPIGSVDLGVGMPTLPTLIDDLLIVGGSNATMGQIKINPQGAGARRITWREILRD